MRRLFRLEGSVPRDPRVERWWDDHRDPLGEIARHWFDVIRSRGVDVEEVLHDGQPTACVSGAAFAYVDAFTSHVGVGFFQGAALPDPARLLVGTGKFMRHAKVRPDGAVDTTALAALIDAAYADVKARLAAERAGPPGSE